MLNALRRSTVLNYLLVLLTTLAARAADQVQFTQQTLDNGLRVMYAPLHQAPVVHVRVLYHVGSRDERADRQGFAHMFEHMMFRGSEHVKPEEHMKLVGMVGGESNAFTSFDETVYVNTLPANQLELVLYLEADRMASFKVSDQIFQIERNVVNEEYRRMQNTPYGTFFEDFFPLVFKVHPYHWTPIGNMEQLRAAHVADLQRFFNTYYVPNNAVLVIAGDFDPAAAKAAVERYFGWIPKAPPVPRQIPAEPPQTKPRQETVARVVPLSRIVIGYHVPPYRSDDHYALKLLASIMGEGNTSRLDRLLVNSAAPLCVEVEAFDYYLEDGGIFAVMGTVLQGKSPDQVEKELKGAVAGIVQHGVTDQEVEKAKIAQRIAFVHSRETAEGIATLLGDEDLFAGDPNRVNTALEKLNAVTAKDIQAVAAKYLLADNSSLMKVMPESPEKAVAAAATQPAPVTQPAPQAVQPRPVRFPGDFPQRPPIADSRIRATLAKGVESTISGVKVIVMPDSRLPVVNWSLTMRAGSYADPVGKEGLASLTDDLVRRGAGSLNYDQLNEDLESRGINIGLADGGDYSQMLGFSLTDQVDHAIQRGRDILRKPLLSPEELAKLKEQTLSNLRMARATPETAADEELVRALFGQSPLGRYATPRSMAGLTLDDVKACWQRLYRPNDAILIFTGDITVERGQALAKQLLDGWEPGQLSTVDYTLPPQPDKLRLIVVDRPEGQQSMIRMGARIYDIQSDEKYAGFLASEILSSDIDARLMRYVRAQLGLVYTADGVFRPARHGSRFSGGAETKIPTTLRTVEAMFKVFADMGHDGVTEQEMTAAKLRTVGGMVMDMQTMQQQATYRLRGVLNGFPIDYYDRFPEHISAVPAAQVGIVVGKYLQPQRMTVVVVGPAEQVEAQLKGLGKVEVVPMPTRRPEEEVQ